MDLPREVLGSPRNLSYYRSNPSTKKVEHFLEILGIRGGPWNSSDQRSSAISAEEWTFVRKEHLMDNARPPQYAPRPPPPAPRSLGFRMISLDFLGFY